MRRFGCGFASQLLPPVLNDGPVELPDVVEMLGGDAWQLHANCFVETR